MNTKSTVFVGALVLIILAFGAAFFGKKEALAPEHTENEHGCSAADSFTFDEAVGACIRETDFLPDIKDAAALAVDHVGKSYGLTVDSFNSYEEPGAYDIILKDNSGATTTIRIRNWKVESESGF